MADLYRYSPEYIGMDYWGAYIGGLQYTANNYYFAFKFAPSNFLGEYFVLVFDNNSLSDSSLNSMFGTNKWGHFSTTFSTSDYYFGMAMGGLLPNTSYEMTGYVYYSGTWYTMATVLTATTTGMTLPSESYYYPDYYPLVRDQYVYFNGAYHDQAGTCVANALASACEIFEHKERSWHDVYYSNVWIYGNDNHPYGSGLYTGTAIEKLKTDGTPRWDRVPGCSERWSDNRHYNDYNEANGTYLGAGTGAMAIVSNNSYLSYQAKCQRINGDGNNSISFYNSSTIANYIKNNGCFIIDLAISETFDNPDALGVIANPTNTNVRGYHSVLLIGWDTYYGKKHWIVQNGWGNYWGNGGIGYIPMDWGIGSHNPSGSIAFRWVYNGYQISNRQTDAPSQPPSPLFDNPARIDGGLNYTWSYTDNSDTYRLRYKNYSGVYNYVSDIIINKCSLTGLEYGVTYYTSVQGRNYASDSAYSGESSATTAPKLCTVTTSNLTTTSVDLNFSDFSGNWSKVKIEWGTNGNYTNSWEVSNPSTSTTIINLTSNTSYNFRVTVYLTVNSTNIYSVDGNGNTSYRTFNVNTTGRPSNWSWTTSIVQGGNINSVDLPNKTLYVITATEWNNFMGRINAFRVYKGLSNYSYTVVTRGSVITKEIINEAINAINGISSRTINPPSLRTSSDVINEAYLYNQLKDALNSVP